MELTYVLNFFIDRFYLHQYYWLALIGISMVNTLLLIVYVATHRKVYLFWGFAGIVIGLFGLFALVMIENSNITPLFKL